MGHQSTSRRTAAVWRDSPAEAAVGQNQRREYELVLAAFARIRPVALGVSVGIVTGVGLLAATIILLLLARGQPADYPVGTHLGLLGQFFPGYYVSWGGAWIGLLYGAATGFVFGLGLGWLLNFSHILYVRRVQRRIRRGVFDGSL